MESLNPQQESLVFVYARPQHQGAKGNKHSVLSPTVAKRRLLGIVLTALLWGVQAASAATTYPYLEDADPTAAPAGSLRVNPSWPRLNFTESSVNILSAEQLSKYDIISAKAGAARNVADAQESYPEIMYLYAFSPRAYQGYLDVDYCRQSFSVPFESTGAATEGCSMFAGHWLYAGGTVLASSLSASGTVASVQDASRVKVGEYVVIYDAPAGSFKNAEHARVTAIDISSVPEKITLSRGYKSTAKSHASGGILAMHVRGQGFDARNWTYNHATDCPFDANGKTLGEVMADWLEQNYTRDGKGQPIPGFIVDGILFDADPYFMDLTKKADADNDLVVDDGISPSGTNLWGDGLEQFYAGVRIRLPDKIIVGGYHLSRGFSALNGTQMEGFPLDNGAQSPTPVYDATDSILSKYSYHLHHNAEGPLYTEALGQTPTRLYPDEHTNPPPASNAPFRFGFGLALLENGFYGQQNSPQDPDKWQDEYAVDVKPGSPTFGQAIASNPANESKVRSHKGWMGQPLGPRVRVYDTSFAPANSLLSNGTFDGNITGWSGDNVTVSRITAGVLTGSGALKASTHINYNPTLTSTKIKGPTVSLTAGQEYTLAFAVRASAEREI
ncbi:MAG: hypothetical protein ACHBNF_09410, partial [Chromatiales bacterium]